MNALSTLPTFIIAGAARSGTTALHDWLNQHPQVYMSPVKETNFFAHLERDMTGPGDDALNQPLARSPKGIYEPRGSAIVTSWAEYQELFAGSEHYVARGEASPAYLYYPGTADRIRARLPKCRLLFVLRDPVERAFSAYKVLVLWGRETETFETALELEEERLAMGWEHIWALRGMGHYASQLEAFVHAFPREQIGIWLYDKLRSEPQALFQEICEFLEVPADVRVDFRRSNRSYTQVGLLKRLWDRFPQTKGIRRTLLPAAVRETIKKLDRRIIGKPLTIHPTTEERLRRYFEDEVSRLQAMLPHLDFSSWLR